MTKGFWASCVVMLAAGGLGYWICSDAPPTTKRWRELTDTHIRPGLASTARVPAEERFSAGEIIEVIDLSRVFEPTGDELALQQLLNPFEERELLMLPRLVRPELLPLPRLVASKNISDAAEEASSPPDQFDVLYRQIECFWNTQRTAILYAVQALTGEVAVPRDATTNEDDR